ncbi:HNH endonuclease [Bacillus cereus group sp. BfR-BA-01380]|uniref:HNH endonuclease n=1 Tax=Bacillus cereus group sp. BfR-BA-01380 TaxID=2920324 RepID=UPI001F59BF8E|nr:HNH endonuclease signature motif containing protein [Bacillus cereus group sp. BfR-BA-01380]
MASKPKKPCAQPLCAELTTDRYCEKHKKKATKYYDKHQRDSKATQFYKSTAWVKVREQVLLRDNYLCRHCISNGKLVPADMVHHIHELKDDWLKRLDMDNLLSLCNACHNKEHGKKG